LLVGFALRNNEVGAQRSLGCKKDSLFFYTIASLYARRERRE